MKRTRPTILLLIIVFSCAISGFAQPLGSFYGLFRDNGGVKLGLVNTVTGAQTAVSPTYLNAVFNISGACLNPYTNSYHFLGLQSIITADLVTGNVTANMPFTNTFGAQYLEAPQFNNSNSTIYGMARKNVVDPLTNITTSELFLATVNPATGVMSEVSTSSVGQLMSVNAGTVIDPYQMVFYYGGINEFIGIDMYSGNIYSTVTPTFTKGTYFENMVYNCIDSTIFGLVRYVHYDTIWTGPGSYNLQFNPDSCTIKLGTINPNTGVVTTISAQSVAEVYSLNASATIDPATNTYYFQDLDTLIGVNLTTGAITNKQPMSHANGEFFDLMRNYQNCIEAKSVRTGLNPEALANEVKIFPNPATSEIQLSTAGIMVRIDLYDLGGRLISSLNPGATEASLDVSTLAKGVYLVKVLGTDNSITTAKFVRQ